MAAPSGEIGADALITADAIPQIRRRFLILHNTRAGHNRIHLVEDVMAKLGRAGAIVDLQILPEDARQPLTGVRVTDYDVVVASGGDGTIRRVLERIDGSGVPLGIIPAGTANVLAAELGIRRRAAQIAAVLLTGRVALMSTGQINESPYLLMGGIGYDGEVVALVADSLKPHLGRFAYSWPIVRALAAKPRMFTATIDGRVREMTWLIVSNASRYAGSFVLSRRTGVLTPGLNVVISRAVSRHQRLAEIMALTAGQLERCRTIEMVSARQIEIARSETLAMQVDGDRFEAPSVRFEASQAQVPILVPKST